MTNFANHLNSLCPLKKLVLFSFAAAHLLTAQADDESPPAEQQEKGYGTLYFINGDRLSGSLDAITEDGRQLYWKTDYADNSIAIDRNVVASIDFHPHAVDGENRINTVVKLTNGDQIFARLNSLHEQELELSTAFADKLSLKPQMVGNVEIMDEGVNILSNINSLEEWENVPHLWEVKNGSIIAPSSGQMAYDIGEVDRMKIAFDLTTSASTYSIGIHAFADNPKSPDSGSNYSIRMGNRWLQASKTQMVERKGMFRDDGRDTIVLGKESDTAEIRSLIGARFEFYFDRIDGSVAVYLDGSLVGSWKDPGDFNDPGSYISITASSRDRVLFDNFAIYRWNGILPTDENTDQPPNESNDATIVALANGDTLTGTIDKIVDDTLLLDTKHFGELRVATNRVRQLSLTNSEFWDQARRMPLDVLATFRDGTKITFALTGLSDGIATLYSENFGTIDTELENLKSLRFLHINESSNDPMNQTELRFLSPQEALGDQW